jgi:transcriptional regulator with XRE-family HTH domain
VQAHVRTRLSAGGAVGAFAVIEDDEWFSLLGGLSVKIDILKLVRYAMYMDAVRTVRMRRGISQRDLAHRAGISFRGLQLLEKSEHDPRVSSLDKVSDALGLPSGGISALLDGFLLEDGRSFRSASVRIVTDGFASWTIHLFDSVDAFRRERDPGLVRSDPVDGLHPKLRALIASTVETLCAELSVSSPWWCCGVETLDSPWFVSGVENLKASALVESPVCFRKRNIFVLANFLERA